MDTSRSGISFVPVPEPFAVARGLAERTGAELAIDITDARVAIRRRAQGATVRAARRQERAARAKAIGAEQEVGRLARAVSEQAKGCGKAAEAVLHGERELTEAEGEATWRRERFNRVLAVANAVAIFLLVIAALLFRADHGGAVGWLVVVGCLCPVATIVVAALRLRQARGTGRHASGPRGPGHPPRGPGPGAEPGPVRAGRPTGDGARGRGRGPLGPRRRPGRPHRDRAVDALRRRTTTTSPRSSCATRAVSWA